jgi:hypothetical protein
MDHPDIRRNTNKFAAEVTGESAHWVVDPFHRTLFFLA